MPSSCVRALTPLLLAGAAWLAAAENLLANPGFEQVDGTMPARWNLFVMPMDGAVGRLDTASPLDGRYSAVLHIPEPYDKEPCNNWSQNIIADLDGKELRVRGSIRTREATEAAIWLQCYRKRPQKLLHLASTSTNEPIHGTNDWTPVDMRVTVPRGTDFVVLRCVLIGRGTAWFDSVVLEDDSDKGDVPDKDKPKPVASGLVLSETERKALLEAHEALVEANRAMRETNKALSERVTRLQEELQSVRKQLDSVTDTLNGTPTTPAAPVVPVPPLVPHGHIWNGERS
jgi:hypothetical protein